MIKRLYKFFSSSLLESHRELTRRDNCRMLQMFEVVTSACALAMLISGFSDDYFRSLRIVYIGFIVVCMTMFVVTRKYIARHLQYTTPALLLNLILMYAFCFFSGIFYNLDGPSISIYAFQVIACSAYLLPFSFTVFFHSLATLLYCITAIGMKPEYGMTDAISGILFLMMGLGLSWQLYGIRLAYLKSVDEVTEQRNKARDNERLERQLRISEKKLYEESKQRELLLTALSTAEEANRAKTVFLSNMSHDLRTPMNAIIGMVDLALESKDRPEQVHENLMIVKNSSAHLLQIINDILDMSRIESGRMNMVEQCFSQTKEVASICASVQMLARKKQQHFESVIEVEHDECLADNERLNRVLTNILGNAVKFTPEGGTIRLEVGERPSKNERISLYCYTITDTGIGMSPETVEKIFEPFFRADDPGVGSAEGTGLGLSIVKNIVDLMGGTIRVESHAGSGSVFTVEIPMQTCLTSEETPSAAAKSSEYEYDLKSVHVLVAEDHPVNQKVAEKILERVGARVTIASNGQEAVACFERQTEDPFSIILMDIQMPVLNGYDAARRIRSSGKTGAKTIPILAMTANAFPEDIKKCLDAGMNEHISKPIHPSELYAAICRYTSASARLKKKRVLVVDDTEVNAAVIQAALQEQYDVVLAENGEEALEILKKQREIVAVITDIQMPKMDGTELIRAIRANRDYDRIAILADTQFGEPGQEERLLALGADDFVYKPNTPHVVLNRLENVLLKYRPVSAD